MTGLGFFLFLSMIVYLIDKNHRWPAAWKTLKACAIVALIVLLGAWGYSYWSERRAIQAARVDTSDPYAAIAVPSDLAQYASPKTESANLKPWDRYRELKPQEIECVKNIRQVFPLAYGDLTDGELMSLVRRKFKDGCPVGEIKKLSPEQFRWSDEPQHP